MDADLRQKIIEELTKFLNRTPTENEIRNCVTDTIIMGKIRDKKK